MNNWKQKFIKHLRGIVGIFLQKVTYSSNIFKDSINKYFQSEAPVALLVSGLDDLTDKRTSNQTFYLPDKWREVWAAFNEWAQLVSFLHYDSFLLPLLYMLSSPICSFHYI